MELIPYIVWGLVIAFLDSTSNFKQWFCASVQLQAVYLFLCVVRLEYIQWWYYTLEIKCFTYAQYIVNFTCFQGESNIVNDVQDLQENLFLHLKLVSGFECKKKAC